VNNPRFAHPVEAELAALLDEHGIRWEYERHRFPLEHGEFVPDFYLPDVGVYLECTVAKQKHVTRKNRKAREASELHGIIVNLLYRRDFERFVREYGLDSQALRVDVHHNGQPGAAHRRSARREEPARARGNASWLRRLRDQLGAVAAAKAEQRRRAEQLGTLEP
jgi:hypothetical protein